jgi:cell division protein FtsW
MTKRAMDAAASWLAGGRRSMDRWLLAAVLILAIWGLLMVYSSSSALAMVQDKGNDLHYVQGQFMRFLVGVALLFALSRQDPRFLSGRVGLLLWGGVIVVLLALMIPAGPGLQVRGARRWMSISGNMIQPSEFARLAMIVALSGMLVRDRLRLRTWRGLLPPMAIVGATSVLIAAEPHMSLGLLTAFTGVLLIFLAGASLGRLILLGVAGLVLAGAVAMLSGGGYHLDRLSSFAHGGGGLAYQAQQSVLTIGSGGLFGRGIGEGLQKYFFLPDPHTDFIMSILVEECGFVGMCVLFLLAGFVVLRTFQTAIRSQSPFGELLCYGVGLQMLLGILVHAAVCLGWAPTTGVPLPLVSFGGSALVAQLMGFGLVLSISNRCADSSLSFQNGSRVILREPALGR